MLRINVELGTPENRNLRGLGCVHSTFLKTSHFMTNVTRNICYGPRLYRFSETLRLHTKLGLLCRAHQIECTYPGTLLASSGQENGRALGSDRHPHIVRIGISISRCICVPFHKLLSLQSSAELIRYSISAIFCEMAVTTPSWAWCIQTAKRDKFLIHWLAIGGLKSRKHRHQ
jgi:hypothetical protein